MKLHKFYVIFLLRSFVAQYQFVFCYYRHYVSTQQNGEKDRKTNFSVKKATSFK